MDPLPIRPSQADLERRRLETTIDQDLASLSMDSLRTTTASSNTASAHEASFSTTISIEYPRAFGEGETASALSFSHHHRNHQHARHYSHTNNRLGPSGTPIANVRKPSGMSAATSLGESPVSTAGHHVSQVTLADGVFRRRDDDEGSEFDPERSLGRLVGELGRVMGSDRLSPRPISPFAHALSPPRSPSPMPALFANGKEMNLSLTLNRSDPLLSPPQSRSSKSSGDNGVHAGARLESTRFSSMARELEEELRYRKQTQLAPPIVPVAGSGAQRRVLSDSTAHNVQQQHHSGSMTPAPKNVPQKDRVRALQSENRRPVSAPAGRGTGDVTADVTGMTGLMETPAKGAGHGTLGKNEDVGGDAGGKIPQTLATLHARLRALETENSLSRRRVRELEGELEKAKGEVEAARTGGERRLREVIGEKTALEDLVKSLRAHLTRLTIELEQNKALVSELRLAQSTASYASPPRSRGSDRELADLRRDVERLDREVQRLGGIVEEGLETRRRARGEETRRLDAEATELRIQQEELERVRRDVERRFKEKQTQAQTPGEGRGPSKLRQGLHISAAQVPGVMPPTVEPQTRVQATRLQDGRPLTPVSDNGGFDSPTPASRSSSDHQTSEKGNQGGKSKSTRRRSDRVRKEGPSSPFPSIRAEDEEEFFTLADSAPTRTEGAGPSLLSGKFGSTTARLPGGGRAGFGGAASDRVGEECGQLPPQTVLARVLRELEDDFAHYKAIYAELADQYKVLDAASAVAKRHVLADHLREVIDTLEQKADQIAALYDLLTFHDEPDARGSSVRRVGRSVHDVMRMVRESLGEEAMERLKEDGVGLTGGRRCHGFF